MAQWHTPLASMQHKQDVWQKLENKKLDPNVDLENEITYFNNPKSYEKMLEYDLFFSYTKVFPLFDVRKPRDDRRYLPEIHENIFRQDEKRAVPLLTSHNYGRPCRKFYDFPERGFNRQTAIDDFYRRYGVMKVIEKEPTQ